MPSFLRAVRHRRAQELAAEAAAALIAPHDRAEHAGRRRAGLAQEAHEPEHLAVAGVRHEQVLRRVDPEALELREQLVLALPHRVEHEVGLAARALHRERHQGARVLRAEGTDRHARDSTARVPHPVYQPTRRRIDWTMRERSKLRLRWNRK